MSVSARGRLLWYLSEVVEVVSESPRASSLYLDMPGWEGHAAGQHVRVRLTAEDGYQAQRSYSIASAPEDDRLALLVERLEVGEASPYLAGELRAGDMLEVRGPVGGWFTWEARDGGRLLLVSGGSGVVPLMATIRHKTAVGSGASVCLLLSSRSVRTPSSGRRSTGWRRETRRWRSSTRSPALGPRAGGATPAASTRR